MGMSSWPDSPKGRDEPEKMVAKTTVHDAEPHRKLRKRGNGDMEGSHPGCR